MSLPHLVLSALLVTVVESSCRAQRHFYPFPAKTYPGTILYKYTKATLTITECQRMCNQVLKCTGFVMRWAGQHGGYCDFFKKDPNIALVDSTGATVYLDDKCPAGYMTYSPESHCYQLVSPGHTFLNARAHCASPLLSYAYLAEIESEEENNAVRQLVVDKVGFAYDKLMLGARRAPGATDRYAFQWLQSGLYLSDSSTHTEWDSSRPDTNPALLSNERCMYGRILSSTQEMRWVDAICSATTMAFVCELDI